MHKRLTDKIIDVQEVINLFKELKRKLESQNLNYVFVNITFSALINVENIADVKITKETGLFPEKVIEVTFKNGFSCCPLHTRNKKILFYFYNKIKSKMALKVEDEKFVK